MLCSTRKFLIQDARRTGACFRVVFADGTACQSREGEPAFTLVFRSRRAEWRTLEDAQRNKMDHVARKIRLQPGERFVDIGCGFGGFLFHAWERYGAHGTGVNTTTEQVAWLREEIRRRGLAGQMDVVEADFRDIPGQYDKVVSIGVLEHAGRAKDLYQKCVLRQ